MLVEGAGRFTLGPIPEVAAQHHTWAELAPYAPPGPAASLCAHERVLRGEDLTDATVEPPVLDVPLVRCSWEPDYALAQYRPDRATFPPPEPPTFGGELVLPAGPTRRDDPRACHALIDLADGWTTGSNGVVRATAVEGDHTHAIGALGVARVRIATLDGAGGLARMAWTAASGGAFGRRRGAATGRLDAWVAAAAVAGIDEWPIRPAALGDSLDRLRWYGFEDLDAAPSGWSLRLAIEDPARRRSWAVVATDRAEPDEPMTGERR
jgi:hypothetical protein